MLVNISIIQWNQRFILWLNKYINQIRWNLFTTLQMYLRISHSGEINWLFFPLKDMASLANIKLRVNLLENHKGALDSTELYVFSAQALYPDSTTHGRMFAPLFGITEDPATGSASGSLGCYLVQNGISYGKAIVCEQDFKMDKPVILHVAIAITGGMMKTVNVSENIVKISKGLFYV